MLKSLLFLNFVINERSCCFSQHIHHKVNFPGGHYLSALRMVDKQYVQKHVSYYYHAPHYFYTDFEMYFRNIVADTCYLL